MQATTQSCRERMAEDDGSGKEQLVGVPEYASLAREPDAELQARVPKVLPLYQAASAKR